MSAPPSPPRSDPPGITPREADQPPPLLGSWRNVYLLVLGTLALVVLLLTLFTRAFS